MYDVTDCAVGFRVHNFFFITARFIVRLQQPNLPLYPAFCDSSLELVYPLSRHLDDPLLGKTGEVQF